MKSFVKIFIYVLLFVYISCTCNDLLDFDSIGYADEDYEVNKFVDSSASVSSCNNRELSSYEIVNNVYKCCYLNKYCELRNEDNEKAKFNLKYCYPVSKQIYDNLRAFIEQEKSRSGCQVVEIQCNSSYLELALIFLILFLL